MLVVDKSAYLHPNPHQYSYLTFLSFLISEKKILSWFKSLFLFAQLSISSYV